jgi:hypothetical protein
LLHVKRRRSNGKNPRSFAGNRTALPGSEPTGSRRACARSPEKHPGQWLPHGDPLWTVI